MSERPEIRPRPADARHGSAGRWLDLLAAGGYRPRLERSPDRPDLSVVAFEHEGSELVLFLDDADPGYYQLAVTYGTEGVPADAATLLGCANAHNDRARVVKAVVDLEGEAASFLVEAFAESPPSADVLQRSIYQLRRAAEEFFERVRASALPRAMA
jgi:hypothetical protein